MRIQASIITSRTREHLIPATLDSIRPFTDQILLIELLGGTDRTCQLVYETGLPIQHHVEHFAGSISPYRNTAISNAPGAGWVCHIDTDERLLNGDRVRELLAAVPAHIQVVSVQSVYGHTKPFFFRVPSKVRFDGTAHEELTPHEFYLLPVVRYWEEEKTPEQLASRLCSDIPVIVDQHATDPDNPRWPQMLGVSCRLAERYKEACSWFFTACLLHQDKALRAWCLAQAAECALDAHDWRDAFSLALVSTREYELAEAYCVASQAALELKNTRLARRFALHAVRHGHTPLGRHGRRQGHIDPAALYDKPWVLLVLSHTEGSNAQKVSWCERMADQAEAQRQAWERGDA